MNYITKLQMSGCSSTNLFSAGTPSFSHLLQEVGNMCRLYSFVRLMDREFGVPGLPKASGILNRVICAVGWLASFIKFCNFYTVILLEKCFN